MSFKQLSDNITVYAFESWITWSGKIQTVRKLWNQLVHLELGQDVVQFYFHFTKLIRHSLILTDQESPWNPFIWTGNKGEILYINSIICAINGILSSTKRKVGGKQNQNASLSVLLIFRGF